MEFDGFTKDGDAQATTSANASGSDQWFTSDDATIYVNGDKSVRPFDQTTDSEKNKQDFGADWQTKGGLTFAT